MPRKKTPTLPLPPLARIGRGKNAKLLLENTRLRERLHYLEAKTKALGELYSVCQREPMLPLGVAKALAAIGPIADRIMAQQTVSYTAEYREYVLDVCEHYKTHHQVPTLQTARAFGVSGASLAQWQARRARGLPQNDVREYQRRDPEYVPLDPEVALAIETAAREAEKHSTFADSGLAKFPKVVQERSTVASTPVHYESQVLDVNEARENAFELPDELF